MLTKIGWTAWQNRTGSKNQTDLGCSCKRGVTALFLNKQKKELAGIGAAI